MEKTIFHIKRMDCASEESMVRMKLDGIDGIRGLQFDLANRRLTIFHERNLDQIKSAIDSLNLASSLESSHRVDDAPQPVADTARMQATLLWKVLIINFVFFLVEVISGLISRSMGLVADSLDMLADAIVYGLSLYAVGTTVLNKKKIAAISGYFQLALALMGLTEVLRRFIGSERIPDFKMMMLVSACALIANAVCLYLLQKSKSEEAHMKASMIFTSNDVIINLGVIIAGFFVFLLDSRYPDLIIGAIVFVLVTRGAVSILRLSK